MAQNKRDTELEALVKNLQTKGSRNALEHEVENNIQDSTDISWKDVGEGARVAGQNLLVGLTRFMGFPGDMFNLLTGGENQDFIGPASSEEYQRFLAESTGLVPIPGQEDQSITGRMVQNGPPTFLLAAGAIGRGASLIKSGTELTKRNIIKKGQVAAAEKPILTLGLEGSAVTGGAALGKTLEEQHPDNPQAARAVGELVGGLGGIVAPWATSTALKYSASLPKAAFNGIRNFTTKGPGNPRALNRAGEIIRSPNQALKELESSEELAAEIPELRPTLRVDEPRFAALDSAVKNEDPAFFEKLSQDSAIASQKLKTTATNTGDPADFRAWMNTRLEGAAAKAELSLQRVKRHGDPSKAAKEVRNILETTKQEIGQELDRKWAKAPANVEITPETLTTTWKETLRDLTEGDIIPPVFGKLSQKLGRLDKEGAFVRGGALIKDEDTPVRAKSLHRFYSSLGRLIDQEKESKRPDRNAIRVLNNLRKSILEDLDTTEAGQEYRQLINLTRDFHNKFNSGAVGSILGTNRSGGPVAAEETLDALIGAKGEKQATLAKEILDTTPGLYDTMANFIRSKFAAASIDTTNNTLNTRNAKTFIKNNEALFKVFPQLRRELGATIGDQQNVDELVGVSQVSELSPLVKNKEGAAIFLQANPGEELQRIFSLTKNRGRALENLVKEAKKDTRKGSPAYKGLQAFIAETLINSSKTSQVNSIGENVISGKKFLSQLSKLGKDLISSGALSKKEFGRLKKIGEVFRNIERTESTSGGYAEVISDAPSMLMGIIGRMGGVSVIEKFGQAGVSLGGGIQRANIGAGIGRKLAGKLSTDQARAALLQFVTDDDFASKMLKNLDEMGTKEREGFVKQLINIVKPASVGGGGLYGAVVPPAQSAAGIKRRPEQPLPSDQQNTPTIQDLETMVQQLQ